MKLAYPKDWTAKKERAFQRACRGDQWIHATNAADFAFGRNVFGWRDDRSPTRYLSGLVLRADPMALRVQVTDIMAGAPSGSEARND